MGLTVLRIGVGNPATPDHMELVDFLVDSGAVYSVVSRAVLEQLNIKPLTEQEFRLANGDHTKRSKGVAVFRYGDRIGGADVIFGEHGDAKRTEATTDDSRRRAQLD